MSRSYRLLCPIARALDRVGDRWTLLILRDLHAGPMRYGEIQAGLPALASNLLATRLEKLQADGLVTRDGVAYALTEAGRRTDEVLWSLAKLGMGFPPDPDPKTPGHHRLVAVTLQMALRQVAPPDLQIVAELVLDGEPFTIQAQDGLPTVRAGAPEAPAVRARTTYVEMMRAAGGDMPLADFRRDHLALEGPAEAVEAFRALMGRVMTEALGAVE